MYTYALMYVRALTVSTSLLSLVIVESGINNHSKDATMIKSKHWASEMLIFFS